MRSLWHTLGKAPKPQLHLNINVKNCMAGDLSWVSGQGKCPRQGSESVRLGEWMGTLLAWVLLELWIQEDMTVTHQSVHSLWTNGLSQSRSRI